MATKGLCVITGASSGIGAATAQLLSQAGHPLLLLARRVEQMEALKLQNCICAKVDVMDRAGMVAAIQEAEKKFGPTDLLVNNAGVMLLGEMHKQDPSEWDKMIDVNLKGLLNGVHAVVGGMKTRKHGTIINISSIAGFKTFPNHAAYCATKYGVHGLTETLREELSQDNVRVCVISPGAVDTELLSHTTDNSIKEGYNTWKTEMGGVLRVNDVASAICYAYSAPQNVIIREIALTATKQAP